MVSCSLCELVVFFLKPRKTCTTNNLCMRDKKKQLVLSFLLQCNLLETLWFHSPSERLWQTDCINTTSSNVHTVNGLLASDTTVFFFFPFISSFKEFRYWLSIQIWVEIRDRKLVLVLQNTNRASCASSWVTTYSIECTKHYVTLLNSFCQALKPSSSAASPFSRSSSPWVLLIETHYFTTFERQGGRKRYRR